MINYKQPGEVLKLVAPYNRSAGQGAKVGHIFGVAVDDVTSGNEGSFAVEGVFTVTKKSSDSWSQGDPLFWDDTNKWLTKTATAGMFVGYACADDAGSTSSADVLLGEAGGGGAFAVGSGGTVTALTDNGGGAAADGTIGAITSAANAGSADVAPVKDAIMELSTKVNELITKLQAAGILS